MTKSRLKKWNKIKLNQGQNLLDRKMASTLTRLTGSDHYDNVKWVSTPCQISQTQAGLSDPNFGVGKVQRGAVSDNCKTGAKCRM